MATACVACRGDTTPPMNCLKTRTSFLPPQDPKMPSNPTVRHTPNKLISTYRCRGYRSSCRHYRVSPLYAFYICLYRTVLSLCTLQRSECSAKRTDPSLKRRCFRSSGLIPNLHLQRFTPDANPAMSIASILRITNDKQDQKDAKIRKHEWL